MAYTPTTWANSPSTATPLSAANLNKMETGIDQAHDHLDNNAIHVPTAGAGGTTNFLRADGTWAAPPGGAGISDGDKGDITVSASGTVWTVDNNSISNAKLAQIATARIRGRVTAATGNVEDLTGTQATTLLDIFTTSLKGLAPASGGGTTNFLRADGTWAAPPGGAGISDGDKGDITVSGSGAVWTIDNGAVTLAKQANVNTARIMGRVTAASGVQEELTGAQATTLLDTFNASLKGLAPASGGGTTNFLRADGTWANPPGGAGISDGDKGDITVSGSGTVWTIDNNTVSNAKLAQIATARFHGRVTAATGNVEDLTGTQATTLLDTFTAALKGLAPASGGGTTNFLRADGTWAAPPGGGGVTDGDKGDITVSGGGTVWSIDANAVVNSDLAQVATATVKGRSTAGTGNVEDLTGTQVAALLPTAAASTRGVVVPPGGSTTFLRADGTWATPASGGSAGTTFHTYDSGATIGSYGGVPSNSLGADGDFARCADTGWVFGPKAAGAWPAVPAWGTSVGWGEPALSAAGGLSLWKFHNGVGACEASPNTGAAGTQLTAVASGRFTEVGSTVWSTGVGGEIEIGGNGGKVYNQFGNTYESNGFVKGGSYIWTLTKLPTGSAVLKFGLGQQYGAPIPCITINASGQVAWSGADHGEGVVIGSVQANDVIYMHSAWGKYDLVVRRAGALLFSSVNSYSSFYTLGGTHGFFMQSASGTYGNALNARVMPGMQTVIF